LTGKETTPGDKDLFMVTNFNNMHIAFRVHTVVGIQRISWADIRKPDKTMIKGEEGIATGIAQCGNELVTVLDFEKIVADIAPETGIQLTEIEEYKGHDREAFNIVMAEDSVLLTRMIMTSLSKAGYRNIRNFNNGQEAWEYLKRIRYSKNPEERVDLIITDIEMPQMDGHRLTKLVKSDDILKEIPLIIFSSLISPEMEIKGKELGADEQLTKPEIGHLVAVMDSLLRKQRK
jgi:two-component system chemotaxis response regulator CheV